MPGGCSLVRELHVYGTAAPVHSRDPKKFQHQGIGTLLMEEAERIAREEHGSGRIAVISGESHMRSTRAKLMTRCRNERLLPTIGLLPGWTVHGQGSVVRRVRRCV